MHKYLILQNPGHNRVYYNLAGKLALAELKIAAKRFKADCQSVDIIDIKGIRYISINTTDELTEGDLKIVSRLSFFFALFKAEECNGQEVLMPLDKFNYEYVDDKISSLLKYSGKTNELFTKMMVNVALLSSDFKYEDSIQLLDPVAGRGTTLFESTIYGFHATGVEKDAKAVHDASVFFKKFIEAERYKHKSDKRQIGGSSRKDAVYMQWFEYARDKEEFKDDNQRKFLGYINGHAQEIDNYFNAKTFDLIVGDLPYGIAHGNKSGQKSTGITRNPSELLDECLPGWFKCIKKGGVIVVAWNSFVVSPKRIKDVFAKHGFTVLEDEAYFEFEHMVDRSIKRDIIVAKRV